MKKLTKNNSIAIWMIGLICIISIFSCDHQWDDFKKYNKDGEILYVGKFDTVLFLPGKEQVRLWGLLTPDPKIVKYKVFWNSNKDSATFDVGQVADTIDQKFKVSEGVTSFTLYTYDADGNSSVGVTAVGSSYGARYRSTLSNRKIKSSIYDFDGKAAISWDLIDMGLFPIQIEVKYQAQTGDTIIIIPPTENTTILKGNQSDVFSYRTVFRPVFNQLNCIDTFCTAYSTAKFNQVDVTKLYLANTGYPFLRSDGGTSRFGILKDWTTTAPVKNISGGVGGFDSNGGGGYMAMERWGTPSIPNGKIYQTVTLPAGKYQVDMDFESFGISNQAYIAVAAGTTLPDVGSISGAIGYSSFAVHSFQFTLANQTEVSIGIVGNLINDQQWFRARSIRLTKYNN